MRRILIVFLFLNYTNINAQKTYKIKDTINNINIPYASIKIIGGKKGFYTNELGEFSSNYLTNVDSVEISHINYYSIILKVNKLKESIFLKPKKNLLDEIIISTKKKSKQKTIGYIKKQKKLSWFIQPKSKLSTLIKLTKNYNEKSIIKSIQIPIGKKTIINDGKKFIKITPNFNSIFRVELFSNNNNKPNFSLLNEPIVINCNQNSNDIINIDVSNQNIRYPKEGIFISVEMIGDVKNNELGKTILPSFMFTKKKIKNIYTETYIKKIFLGNNWINLKDNDEFKSLENYKMAVGIKLMVYE